MQRYEAILKSSRLENLWIRRVLAFIVDIIILAIVFLILNIILGLLLLPVGLFNTDIFTGLFSGVSTIISLVVSAAYYTFFEGSASATIGKMFMGLKVKPTHGIQMDYAKAFIRNITKLWGSPIFGLLFVLDLLIGFVTDGDPRQRFSDTIAGTIVVSSETSYL